MGKNYVENSLKRFLKRKVKITLGFVVAFLISGVISVGTEITDIPIGYENRVTVGKEINISENINDNFKLKIDGLEKEASLFVLDGAKVFNDKEINVYDSKGQKAIGKVYIKDSEFVNTGLVNLLEINGGKVINNGNIMSDEKNGHWMADGTVNITGEKTTFINEKNGIIRSRNTCIEIKAESKDTEIYNYGLMESIVDEKGTRGA